MTESSTPPEQPGAPPTTAPEQPAAPAAGPQAPATGAQALGAPALPPVLQGRELAGWGSRVGASLIDTLIVLVLSITIIGPFIYAALLMRREGEKNGQTLGKQALGIRVIQENGQPYEFGSAFLREFVIKGLLFGVVGALTLYVLTIVDNLWPLWDEKKQALHDRVASSYVVRA